MRWALLIVRRRSRSSSPTWIFNKPSFDEDDEEGGSEQIVEAPATPQAEEVFQEGYIEPESETDAAISKEDQ